MNKTESPTPFDSIRARLHELAEESRSGGQPEDHDGYEAEREDLRPGGAVSAHRSLRNLSSDLQPPFLVPGNLFQPVERTTSEAAITHTTGHRRLFRANANTSPHPTRLGLIR